MYMFWKKFVIIQNLLIILTGDFARALPPSISQAEAFLSQIANSSKMVSFCLSELFPELTLYKYVLNITLHYKIIL